MPNYNSTAKSLVYGLSDFWTLYFRELPLIEELYRGMEIDVGQIYLDLLSLLLNNSTQDAALFNKQFFKLIRLREDTVTYASDGKYGVALESDIADLKYLNNRVFGSTTALERGIDFLFDKGSRSLLFNQDIFAAYRSRTYGIGEASFSIQSRVPEPTAAAITVTVADTATHPPLLSRNGNALTIAVDSALTRAAEVVALVNTNPLTQGFVQAALPAGTAGQGLVLATSTLPLLRQATAPIEGFASRTFDVVFGTRFRDTLAPRWLDLGVQKGDVLRILGGDTYGSPQEFPIALVREDRLILYPQAAAADIAGGLDYVVLRGGLDDTSTAEAFAEVGTFSSGTSLGNISGATRTIEVTAPAVTPEGYHIGQVVILAGCLNAGEYVIREVTSFPFFMVLDGNPLVDELAVPFVTGLNISDGGYDGVLAAPDADGLSLFSSATTSQLSGAVGGVLSVFLGNVRYQAEVVRGVSATSALVRLVTAVEGSGLTWSCAPLPALSHTLALAPPNAWPTPGTVMVMARRFLDGQAVREGRDYTVNVDRGAVTVRSVWEPSATVTVNYGYRNAVVNTTAAVLSGTGGSFVEYSPPRFTATGLSASALTVGAAIDVTGATNPVNNGIYIVESVVNGNTVSLGGTHLPVFPETGVGLSWTIYRRGSAEVTDVVEPVTELGLWAPDVLVDKYHLYYTFGYLIDRIQVSSEGYRSLIRGLFQLFMLGPTLERFESAVNVVAGLPVVRDDNELFLRYDSGAARSGTTGTLDATTRRFTSATANFVAGDLAYDLYITSGYNAKRTYTITAVIDSTTIELAETPTTDPLVGWELTETGEHYVVTSRETYAFPRAAPIKPRFLDSANNGVLKLRAFEVLTAAFEVTDYVETPNWWESARIPEVLLPDYSAERRQSTPALFENVLGAGDNPHIGDPGFYIGADDTGTPVPTTVLASGTFGTFIGDPLYPIRNTETLFIEVASSLFTPNDVGNTLVVAGISYRIVEYRSPGVVKIESFNELPYDGLDLFAWEMHPGTIALRHTAAYVILDRALKHHLFTLRFDAFLLSVLPTNVISDLKELVFEAKPAYTYLVLTPSLLFEEVLRVTEPEFTVRPVLAFGGAGGEPVLSNANALRVDGSWTLGSWYREVQNSSTFTAPAASVTNALGVPTAGFTHRINRLYIEPSQFTAGGAPVAYDTPVVRTLSGAIAGASVTVVGDEAVLTVPPGLTFDYDSVHNYVTLTTVSANGGRHRIGRLISSQEVVLNIPSAVPETGISVTYSAVGTGSGRFEVNAEGESFFTAPTGNFVFNGTDVGRLIRRPIISASDRQTYVIAESPGGIQVRVAQTTRVASNLTITSASGFTVDISGAYFNDTMTYVDRRAADLPTARQQEFFLTITSGPLSGFTTGLQQYVSPSSVLVTVPFASPQVGVTATLTVRTHYSGPAETGNWELYDRAVVVDNEQFAAGTVTLPTAGVAAGTVNYTAQGVRSPIDPGAQTFNAVLGDTYYAVGGLDPLSRFTRTRSALDIDLREEPLKIIVRPA